MCLVKQYLQFPKHHMTEKDFEYFDRKSRDYSKLMESNGFDYSVNKVEYKSKDFYKILELAGDKFELAFDFEIIYSSKELDEFNFFRVDATSSIAMKNDITYSRQYDELLKQNSKYDVLCSIVGQKVWTKNKMIVISQTKLVVDDYLYSLIIKSDLRGYAFQNIYNITTKKYENAYCLSSEVFIEQSKRIKDKLTYKSTYSLATQGYYIFSKDTFDTNIDFFNIGSKDTGELIVSSKSRMFFKKHKTKGVIFEPVYETDTIRFSQYNNFIKEFANILYRYNHNHIIGLTGERIQVASLKEGLLGNSNSPN